MSSKYILALRVDITPETALFGLGERQQLVCLFEGCTTTPSVSWSILGDRPLSGSISTNQTCSVLTFERVKMEHDEAILCTVSCNGDRKQAKRSVQVYCELPLKCSIHLKRYVIYFVIALFKTTRV